MSSSSSSSSSSKTMLPKWIQLHDDKTQSDLVRTSELEWIATSQAGGVYRRMIERTGTEKVARATTIVKFDPNQSFPRHNHDGGEEFLVLDGVWRDDYGAFPKYSYVRNYIGSGHTPHIGEEGCVILVKLRQMSQSAAAAAEPDHFSWGPFSPLDIAKSVIDVEEKKGDSTSSISLFTSELERTSLKVWPKQTKVTILVPEHGMEIFVVEGSFTSELGYHDKWSWCRIPNPENKDKEFCIEVGAEDAFVWTKEGHLSSDEVGVERPEETN